MRLFTAISFDMHTARYICQKQEKLRLLCTDGRFTLPENHHITLNFIGETVRAEEAAYVMEEISASSFDFTLCGLGRFKRSGGDILWLGIKDCPAMDCIQNDLHNNLMRRGFKLENRDFRPHLTLARQAVITPENFVRAKELLCEEKRVHTAKISLMKSERVNGRLKYTEISYKELTM